MITVRGRELIIPESERQIGTQYDSNSEVRQIKVSRLTAGGVDISHLDFRLDLRYGNEKKDTALLDKEISDEDIILTWTVGPNSVKEIGTVWIAVRGSDDFGIVKWATNQGYLYVGRTIDTPSDSESVDLSEMEALEKRLDQKTAELDTAEQKRVEAENIREENERQRLNNEREWQVQGEKAVQAAKDAQAAASAAEEEKTAAMGYATAAGGSADDARQYAEAASTSAVNADASAKRAEEIAGGLGSYDGTAASVTAVDTHDFTGTGAGKKSTVQALLDKITQKLIEKVVTSDTFQQVLAKYLVNNGLTTEAGKFGLDAAYGKNLQDQITQQNSNITFEKTLDTSTLTLDANVAALSGNWMRLGHQVTVYAILNVGSNGIQRTQTFTKEIPSEFLPIHSAGFLLFNNADENKTFCAYVEQKGIRATEQAATPGIWYASASWSVR